MDRKSLIALITAALAGSAFTAIGTFMVRRHGDAKANEKILVPTFPVGKDKYHTTWLLSKEVINIYQQYGHIPYEDRERVRIPTKWKEDVNKTMEHLLRFMNDNFDHTGVSPKDVANLFSKNNRAQGMLAICNDSQLRMIADRVIPVAVMRELLGNYRVRFDPSKTKEQWIIFARRYQDAILGA